MAALYESPLTAGLTAAGEFFGFMESISPAITNWIAIHIDIDKQRIMDRRIRKCKRICRRGKFGFVLISAQVRIDFSDLPADERLDIANLLDAELKIKS